MGSSTVGFRQAEQYPVGTAPRRVAIGDFNRDHTLDLAVCNFGDPTTSQAGNVSLLLGKGDGSFATAVNFIAVNNCTGIVAGDFDGDSKSDLLVLRTGDASAGDAGDATIFLSNGDATFRKGQTLVPGQNPAGVAVSANARTSLPFVRPRRQYRHAPNPATSRFSASAVGLITSGATANNAIAAM